MSETGEPITTKDSLPKNGEQATQGTRLSVGSLIVLAVLCLAVGIGAGIGAGYGIFHKDSTSAGVLDSASASEQWLVVMNGDNGTMSISPDGSTSFQVDALRSRAPAFTNVPERIATLANRDTAFDFIDEGLVGDNAVNVILSFKNENTTFMVPVTLNDKVNSTGDSANFGGTIDPQYLQQSFNETSFPIDDVNMFILSGSSPSQLDFN